MSVKCIKPRPRSEKIYLYLFNPSSQLRIRMAERNVADVLNVI